jgi:hypothetical protein
LSIVPVSIRPHLIPFFFKEFEGQEAKYLGQKVKAIRVPTSSSLGCMMRMFMVKVEKPAKVIDHYQLYLSVADNPGGGKAYEGNYYKFESGSRSFLELPAEVNKDINNLLEDIYRITFVSFMDGFMTAKDAIINDGLNQFIDKYDLLEVGQTTDSMRQLYYREKKKRG